jgi:hypothetical protein
MPATGAIRTSTNFRELRQREVRRILLLRLSEKSLKGLQRSPTGRPKARFDLFRPPYIHQICSRSATRTPFRTVSPRTSVNKVGGTLTTVHARRIPPGEDTMPMTPNLRVAPGCGGTTWDLPGPRGESPAFAGVGLSPFGPNPTANPGGAKKEVSRVPERGSCRTCPCRCRRASVGS